MKLNKAYLVLFSICAFLSVFTTIGIHSGIFDFDLQIFNEEVKLYKNSIYNFGKWWIIAHCLLVLSSMWGIFLILYKRALPIFGFGFLFYAVFAITEIYRQLLYLFYLNGQYRRYELAENIERSGRIMHDIKSFDLTSYALYAMFILAFALGNLCYGIGLVRGAKWDKILAVILLFWALQGFVTLGNEFWEISWIDTLNESFGLVFQPLARFIVGYWFIVKIQEKWNLKPMVEFSGSQETISSNK